MATRIIKDDSGREIAIEDPGRSVEHTSHLRSEDRPERRSGKGKPYRFSWSALFAGAIAALGVWILLYALGAALGVSTADPSSPGGMRGPGIFTGVFGIIAPIIALFIGGVVASRTAGPITRVGGGLHGMVMWSLTAVAGVWLVANLFGSVFSTVVSVGGQVASGVAAEQGTAGITSGVEEQLSQAQAQGAQIGEQATSALPEAGGALWVAFGSLLLGLLAAVIGGFVGVTGEQRLAAEQLAMGTPAFAYPTERPVATEPRVVYGEARPGVPQGVPPGVPLPVTAEEQAQRRAEVGTGPERRRADDGRLDSLQREVAGLRADVREVLGRNQPGLPH